MIVAAGWGLVLCGLMANAWARRRERALLERLSEDEAGRHDQIIWLHVVGIGLGLVAFFWLGRGAMALSVALGVLGATALGEALVRVQLPGPEGMRQLLAAELAASWAMYAGVAMVLWG